MQNRIIKNRNLKQAIQAKNVGKPKLLDEVRARLRALHFSKRTEEAYVAWIHRFLLHVKNLRGDWVHPSCLGCKLAGTPLT